MGFLDSLFSDSSSNKKGGVPSYLRDDYRKFGLDPDENDLPPVANEGKKMYCTRCRRIYNGGCVCPECRNLLVEWH